jgi:hypothetical protein
LATTAILGVDSGITGVIAHNSNISIGYNTSNAPLFSVGSASLWNFDGAVSLPFAWEYNAPGVPVASVVTGASAGVPMSGAGPLDFLNSSNSLAGAYSCARGLSFVYKGPLCNIRRASDSASIDFFADATGAINKSDVTSFCANTTCYITTEYDQTGNSNHARNAVAATQPVLTIEGPGLNYAACGVWGNGGNALLTVTQNGSINGLYSTGGFASVVHNKTATITNSMRLLSKAGGGSGWEVSGGLSLGYGYPQFTTYASSVNGAWVSSTSMPSTGGHIFDVAYSYGSLANIPGFGVDGSAVSYQSSTQPAGTISDANNLIIGNTAAGGFGWPGDICEVLLARQSLSATQIEAIRRNQAVFYGLSGVL